MKGIFEIHLITKPEYQTQLFGFIADLKNDKLIRPRPTCAHALYGDYPVQPMLTFWLSGHLDEVTKIVQETEESMIKSGIPIIRTKIEAMPSNDLPNLKDVTALARIGRRPSTGYFEYHFKVKINSTHDWNNIVQLITEYGAHLFYNPYNKTLNPIVTIRRYTSLDDLDRVYTKVKELLESQGYTLTSPEKEYSVYDSNVDLDKNWLFEEEPTNFITTLNPKMIFASN
jgi:hypothetical protein